MQTKTLYFVIYTLLLGMGLCLNWIGLKLQLCKKLTNVRYVWRTWKKSNRDVLQFSDRGVFQFSKWVVLHLSPGDILSWTWPGNLRGTSCSCWPKVFIIFNVAFKALFPIVTLDFGFPWFCIMAVVDFPLSFTRVDWPIGVTLAYLYQLICLSFGGQTATNRWCKRQLTEKMLNTWSWNCHFTFTFCAIFDLKGKFSRQAQYFGTPKN